MNKLNHAIVLLLGVCFRCTMRYSFSVWARNWKRWDTCLTKLKKVRHMSRPAETHVSPSWKRWDIHQAEKVIETLATRTRRLREDQIEVFKILNGYETIDSNIFSLEIKQSKITRGHNFTLVKKQSRLDVRKFSFSKRTINVWNKLSTECVHSSSVNVFKNKIDKYLVKAGYT